MATQDNSSGLLAKVAKFVRNPTTDWADLDKIEAEVDTEQLAEQEPAVGYSKQTLKNVIERKRHDDAIRKREFNDLRKLRKNAPVITPELAEKTSFFRGTTGYSDLDERAETLKKIDDIEAQMSKQWWKGHPAPAVGEAIEPKVNPGKMTPVMRPSEDASFDNKSAFASTLAIDEPWGEDNASTLIGVTSNTEPILSDPARFKDAHSPSQEADPSEFPASKLFAVEMGDGLSDPDLEEAAIRFANGDDAGAEAVLLAALQPLESSKASADVWATALFDLYRSTGQHVSFERLALDYAQRFGQSAPVWFSTPEQLQSNTQRLDPTPKSAANAAPQAIWLCSPELDAAAVDQLRIRFLPNSASATLNWAQLQSMTSAAAQALAILFAQWCDQPLVLHFDSAKMLEKVLRTATPLGDAQVPQFWWQLRLDMLRILHLQDEFELAALDYCVTYEVSPPPWKNPRCSMLHELTRAGEGGGHGAVSVQVTADDDWKPSSGFARSVLLEPETEKSLKVELIGELQGDPSKALASLGAAMKNTEKLVISCMRLVRVDFSAAGSILNWVANGEAMGCQIEFRDVPCLVATFFNLIGINEHAQVMSRTN